VDKANRLAQKSHFEQSLCFEHKGLRLIGGLVETNSVNPCLKKNRSLPREMPFRLSHRGVLQNSVAKKTDNQITDDGQSHTPIASNTNNGNLN